MSHLALGLACSLALSLALACSGSKPAEPAVPGGDPSTEPEAASSEAASSEAASPEPEPAAAEPAAGTPTGDAKAPDAPANPAAPATAAQAVTKTLFVAPTLAECQGEAPQQCLQVRELASEPYRRLYTGIAGFEYEPSYEYELRVEATPVPNAPADAGAVSYRLLEVVAKRTVAAAKGK